MKNDLAFKVIESKIKLKGDPELNFYYNKMKKEIKQLQEENKKLKEQIKK